MLLLVVVLFFENGVADGVSRFRNWLGVAQERYRLDGWGDGVALSRETAVGCLAWFRDGVRSGLRGPSRCSEPHPTCHRPVV